MIILYAFLSLILLGGILGLFLSIADKKLSINKDPKLIELEKVLPNANCGMCGFAGCSSYADAVFSGNASVGLCVPGGQATADKCASIMGVSQQKVEKLRAFIFCNSDFNSTEKDFNYKGLSDCNAVYQFFKGSSSCKEGCMHLASCMSVCSENAITIDSDGKLSVVKELCIGCGKCTQVCPTQVIKLIPYDQKYAVKCNNHLKGGVVRKICSTSCIGCKICQTKYPNSGFTVMDNLASYSTETALDKSSDEARENCPQNIIFQI